MGSTGSRRMSMWIVTMSVNDYNQHGDYFIAAYQDKPTFADLRKLLPHKSDTTIGKLTRGGGRQAGEDEWHELTEVEDPTQGESDEVSG